MLRAPMAALLAVAATVAFGGPASADVSEVSGGAYGIFAHITLFGGAQPDTGPTPSVTLPPNGSSSPITDSAPSAKAQYGPAVLVDANEIKVSTEGTTGANGSVTSSATVDGKGEEGVVPVFYDRLASTCTARESGLSGSTTVGGGKLVTSTLPQNDPNAGAPKDTEDVPANPPANYERTGNITNVGDSFRVVYNEQIKDGASITVNAVHLFLLGPTAVGDLIIGQSRCSTKGSGTSSPTTTPPGSQTTTTKPATSGTTVAGGSGGSGGSGSSSMPKTGTDVLPLTFLGAELVVAGIAAVRWATRRRAWPHG